MTRFGSYLLLIASLVAVASAVQPHHAARHAHSVSPAQTSPYPKCPFTGLYPTKPNVTFTRCLDASEYTCCSDCTDRRYALAEISANGSTLITQVSAGLGSALGGKDIQLCGTFVGFADCQNDLEQIICATGCNPESGNFLDLPPGQTGELRVCNAYANTVYAHCKALQLPGFGTLETYFPTAERFMTILFGKVGSAFGVINYKVVVTPEADGTAKCYNGPKKLAPASICCDPLEETKQCPLSKLNVTMNPSYLPFVNRTVNPAECSAGGNNGGASAPLPSPSGGSPSTSPTSSNSTKEARAVKVAPAVLGAVGLLLATLL